MYMKTYHVHTNTRANIETKTQGISDLDSKQIIFLPQSFYRYSLLTLLIM